MKVSRSWLKELVDLKVSEEELIRLLPLRTIGTKDVTPEFIELDMKGYNRADLLSLRGVAYEVAAITDSKIKLEEMDPTKFVWVDQSLPKVEVKVEDENLAPVYCLAKIEGLKVEPSSAEWKKKLEDSGLRVVNNVADVTNLVMLEYGQPLHAFDAKAVKDETIIVRRAKKGERITTLDGKTRDLEESDLLITDPQNNLGIAGVMGGKDSEISDSTTTVLLEAAIFDPVNLRRTATRLNLQSEANKRFYHGLTKKRLLQALNAAIRLYQKLGGHLTGLTMVGDLADQAKKVTLTLKKVNNLIGVEISEQQVEEYLKKLNFTLSDKVEKNGEISWVVTPPYYRLDIEIEEDLIEEVTRLYGYEKIPPKELAGELPEKTDQSLFNLIYDLKTALVEQGFTELQTYSYFSTAVLKNLDPSKEILIKIANPISAETEYLRNKLWPNLLEKAAENLKYFNQVAIFEVGKTYQDLGRKILEEYSLAILLVDGTDNPLARLNQALQRVFTKQGLTLELGDRDSNLPHREVFHPNRSVALNFRNQPIGGINEIHPRIANSFGIEKRVAIAEIKIEKLI